MTLNQLYDNSMNRWSSFKIEAVLPALQRLNQGALDDVLNTNGCRYYQWLPCLIDEIKPKHIVELGGAMGVADLMMLHSKVQPEIYSITLPEHGLEFSYIVEKYKNFHPIVGDDLILTNWPKHCVLGDTDIWFFDSLHTQEQLTKELELYTPFFKEGTILLFDDIHMDEIWPIWEILPYEKKDITDPCHYSGFGIARV